MIAGALAPLRRPDFRWFFAAEVVNLAGSMMAPVALAFAVLEVEDSPNALGLVLAAHSVPLVVFLLAGGVLADRVDRTVVIWVSNIVSGLSQGVIAALILTGHAELWQLIALSAVNGCASAAGFPALWGVVPQLVDRAELQSANVLMSMSRNALAVLGPGISAGLVAGVGAGWALAVDAATWGVAALLLLRVRIPPRPGPSRTTGALVELREGWQLFWGTGWLWLVVVCFAGINMLHAGAWSTLGPIVADRTFGARGWGLALSTEAAGLLLTNLVLLRLPLNRPLLAGTIGTLGLGLPVLVLAAEPAVWQLAIATFITGIGLEVFAVGWNLAMQEHVPEAMLSRAYSYDALGSFVAIPLGQLAAGPLATQFGFRPVLLAAGLTMTAWWR